MSLSWIATLSGKRVPVVAAAAEPRHDIGQRAGDQEILLDEPQAFAAGRRVVGVEDPRERLGRDLLVDGVEEVAAAELQEVEVVMCRRAPEPQRVDRPAAVADDRPVVRRADEGRRDVPDHLEPPLLQLEGAVQPDVHGLPRAADLPGVGTAEPVVGVLDLPAVGDLLAEDPVLVPQAVADRGELERRHRVEEAGGEPAQAAVAQAGVGLHLGELRPVELLALHRLPHDRLDPEVEDVVGQRPADQELHREVVDLLGVGAIVGRVRLQPALRQQVAERPGHGLETLARVGLLRPDDVVEDQPAARRRRRASRRTRPARIRTARGALRAGGAVRLWWPWASLVSATVVRRVAMRWSPSARSRIVDRDRGRSVPAPDLSGDGVAIVVPEEDGRVVQGVLVAEDAERRGAEPEVARVRRRQAQPASGQDAEEVAVAEEDDAAAGPFEASHDAVGPGADRLHRLTPGTAVAEQVPARAAPRGSRPWSGPRTRRSPTPAGRPRARPRAPNPASSHVLRARPSGLTKTSSNVSPLSRSPRLRALASPRAVSGMSVRPVCWREIVQAVSPCRAR